MARRIKIPELEKHAQAIGYLCILWRWLESHIDQLLAELIPLEHGETSVAVLSNIEFRDKVQMTKALAYTRRIDEDWFERVRRILDVIDNELRPKRNRYIHDVWERDEGKVIKLQWKISLKRPQARKPIRLETHEIISVPVKEVWNFVEEIRFAIDDLVYLHFWYESEVRRASSPDKPT